MIEISTLREFVLLFAPVLALLLGAIAIKTANKPRNPS